MSRGFALPLLLVIIFFATVAAVVYFRSNSKEPVTSGQAQSSPNPYLGWKTYMNSTYKFVIKYPNYWFIREYYDQGVNFLDEDTKEATSSAVKVRFIASNEKADTNEFKKIFEAKDNSEIVEHLDVESIITKIKNLEFNKHNAVEYTVNRNFSALVGPQSEYRHVYKINKDGTILTFSSSSETQQKHMEYDWVFGKMIKSLVVN